MKKRIFYISLLCSLCALSCSEQAEEPIEVENVLRRPLVFKAVPEDLDYNNNNGTRAVGVLKYEFRWSENDQIVAINNDQSILFDLVGGVNTSTGTFQQIGTEQIPENTYAYYPKSLFDNGALVWPSEQHYSETMTGMPMVSKLTVTSSRQVIGFTNLGLILQANLGSSIPDIVLQSLTLECEGKKLAGEFNVVANSDGNQKAVITDAGEDKISVGFGDDGLNISNAIRAINIYMPAVDDSKRHFVLTLNTKDNRQDKIQFDAILRQNKVVILARIADGFGYNFSYKVTGNDDFLYVNSERPVTYVGYNTFGKNLNEESRLPECLNITEVNLPNTIETLGDLTFFGESYLTEIALPEGLLSIGKACFQGAGLTSVTIPASIESIGELAFADCSELESVSFMGSVPPASIGASVFQSSVPLTIYVPAGSKILYEEAFETAGYDPEIEVCESE